MGMEVSHRVVKLNLKPDILAKFISYLIRWLTWCVRENKPQIPYIQYHSMEYLQNGIPGDKLTACWLS
jgi:hypothetical protein